MDYHVVFHINKDFEMFSR